MPLDLKSLQTFRLVARFGSLSRAAGQLGLTTPAVSIQIRNLEMDLGVKLFDHRPNRVTLTHHGRVLLREANGILESVVQAREAVTRTPHNYEGNLPIAVASDLSSILAKKISAFTAQHPNLGVTILARRTRESIALVLSGEIDMAIGYFPRVPKDLTKKPIMETTISLMVPRSHPLAGNTAPKLSDIFACRVITRLLILDDAILPRSNPIHLPNLIAVDTCQSAIDFVQLQQGVGLVHDICAEACTHKNLVKIDVSKHFAKTSISILTRSNASLGPAANGLIQKLIS
jgi:DNA-binding transcriptional LysR family regulator